MGSYKQSLIGVMAFFLVLNAIVVATRIYVRVKLVKAFGWDDGFLFLSFLVYAVACLMGFISMHYGFAANAGEHELYFDIVKMNKFYWANQLCLYISSGIAKVAVALVLYRLSVDVKNRIILGMSIIIVVTWSVIMTIFSSDICADNPNGVSNYVSTQTCSVVGYIRMISNILIDYFYALYPIPMLWGATLNHQLKVIVCCLLGLGMLASAATVAKLVILVKLQTATGVRVDWLHYQMLLWADIELGLSIFAASAAALRPLVRVLSGYTLTTFTKTKTPTATTVTANRQALESGSISNQGLAQNNKVDPEPPVHARPSSVGGFESVFESVFEEYELSTIHSRDSVLQVQKGVERTEQDLKSAVA